jgi:hypothetical protein
MEAGGAIVAILSAIMGYLVYDTYYQNEVEYIISNVDKNTYLVRSLPDKQEAADLIARIRGRLETFVGHMNESFQDDERVQRLVKNFQPDKIYELFYQ